MNERSLKELDGRIAKFRTDKGSSTGVVFTCPSCPPAQRHHVVVNWEGPSILNNGNVWTLESAPDTSVLTLSPLINFDDGTGVGCRFHGFVRAGKVQWTP
jgi:hypothetical protein